jgi:hypothetical protein
MRLLLALLLVVAAAPFAEAAPCTAGVDCYCDRVAGGDLNDPLLLVCEDFDSPAYYQDVGLGTNGGVSTANRVGGPGAAQYSKSSTVANGSWWSGNGSTNNRNRGGGSLWWGRYGNFTQGYNWGPNQPTTPQSGNPCNFDIVTTSGCSGGPVWHPTGAWGSTADSGGGPSPSTMFVIRNGEFALENHTAPTNASGGGSGVFDGNASMAWRQPPGSTAGTGSGKSFGAIYRTFGMTVAMAYPLNSTSSGIWGGSWKHMEFCQTLGNCAGDGLLVFHNQGSRLGSSPFSWMFMIGSPEDQAACTAKLNASIAAGLKPFGHAFCDLNGNLNYGGGSNYLQSRDWPDGMWGCVRGYFENMGTVSSRIRIWLTTGMVTDLPIVDLTMDFTGQGSRNGYGGLFWDHYKNFGTNTVVTYRYKDNLHIRAGAPVSCNQIGFGAVGTPPRNPPTLQQLILSGLGDFWGWLFPHPAYAAR